MAKNQTKLNFKASKLSNECLREKKGSMLERKKFLLGVGMVEGSTVLGRIQRLSLLVAFAIQFFIHLLAVIVL